MIFIERRITQHTIDSVIEITHLRIQLFDSSLSLRLGIIQGVGPGLDLRKNYLKLPPLVTSRPDDVIIPSPAVDELEKAMNFFDCCVFCVLGTLSEWENGNSTGSTGQA